MMYMGLSAPHGTRAAHPTRIEVSPEQVGCLTTKAGNVTCYIEFDPEHTVRGMAGLGRLRTPVANQAGAVGLMGAADILGLSTAVPILLIVLGIVGVVFVGKRLAKKH
jgi:hypothetical protein